MVDWKSKTQRAKFAAAVKAVQAGDNAAAEEILVAMEPLVLKMAKHYGNPGTFEFDDLLQAGRIAIYEAILGYVPSKSNGASLATYCYRPIRWGMLQELHRSPGDSVLDNALTIGQTYDHENGGWIGENIPDRSKERRLESEALRERRQAVLDRLFLIDNEMTRQVVFRRLHGESYAEIAKDLGVSRARVHQRGKRGLTILSQVMPLRFARQEAASCP